MKYRNELILLACFVLGNIIASWPSSIVDYAERLDPEQHTIAAASEEIVSLPTAQ